MTREEQVRLWKFIAHGSGRHRVWLIRAIHAFFDGRPRPEVIQ